ncbi:MAG: hypothetical protein FD124_3363, partial [Alphaproteobacteria bacterium]
GVPPASPDIAAAQARAIDSLLGEPALRGVVQDLLDGRAGRAFDALERDADATASPDKWNRAGILMFAADRARAGRMLEKAFAAGPPNFWGGILLARLRGSAGDFKSALEAAGGALMAAQTPAERGVAHAESATIAMVQGQASLAMQHANSAVEISRADIKAGARDPFTMRDLVARLVMLGDACVAGSVVAGASGAYVSALEGARTLASVDPKNPELARGVAEILEKAASAFSSAQDHASAGRHVAEAVSIRRRLAEGGRDAAAVVALAGALNTSGEVQRQAGDLQGAKASFDEAMSIARQAVARDPSDVGAKREVWSVMWRLATMGAAGVSWRDVLAAMEGMANNGGLNSRDWPFYEEAKRRAAAS